MTATRIAIPLLPAADTGFAPLAVIRVWQQRRRERSELRRLLADAHLLADTGLERRVVEVEAAKPFWLA